MVLDDSSTYEGLGSDIVEITLAYAALQDALDVQGHYTLSELRDALVSSNHLSFSLSYGVDAAADYLLTRLDEEGLIGCVGNGEYVFLSDKSTAISS